MSCKLVIKTVQPPAEVPVDVNTSATIEELKEQIAGRVGLPKENIRLVCAGKIWQDQQTVASYEPKEGAIVHCLNNPPRVTPGSAEQTLSVSNPMALMGGGGGGAMNNVNSGDPMQQMMAQSQQMMAQNPEMMQQLMNSPMVQQMMSDPETIRAMMRMNPQLNQLMETRPEIARLLDDPETMQQSMRMMANPSLMREMMRNQDRAIGQLNAIPGGENALARAHQEIADPLFAAFSGGGANGSGEINTYSDTTEGAPNTESLPNPWGPPPAQTPSTSTPTPALGGGTSAPQSNPAAPNPFASMMMQPPATTGAQPGVAPGANPMQNMMQQMMQNPAMMQQSMQMAQQMFGGSGGMGMGTQPTTPIGGSDIAPGGNPMQDTMQQMMQNPAMMQQSMQMAQQMFGGGGMGMGMQPTAPIGDTTTPPTSTPQVVAPNPSANLMLGGTQAAAGGNGQMDPFAAMMQQMMANPGMLQPNMAFQPGMNAGTSPTPTAAPMTEQMQRIRFASQLTQLTVMGFTNEAACLNALAQHHGRVDAAIDTLLSSGA
jgi:ubiquilin